VEVPGEAEEEEESAMPSREENVTEDLHVNFLTANRPQTEEVLSLIFLLGEKGPGQLVCATPFKKENAIEVLLADLAMKDLVAGDLKTLKNLHELSGYVTPFKAEPVTEDPRAGSPMTFPLAAAVVVLVKRKFALLFKTDHANMEVTANSPMKLPHPIN
jgi:hypothetical protein